MVRRFESEYQYISLFQGWGTDSDGSDKLFEIEVPVVSNTVCQEAMKNYINVSFKHKLYEFTTKISDNC